MPRPAIASCAIRVGVRKAAPHARAFLSIEAMVKAWSIWSTRRVDLTASWKPHSACSILKGETALLPLVAAVLIILGIVYLFNMCA